MAGRGEWGRHLAKVLVIEDERDVRDIIAYNLRQAGHEVLTASGGNEGLRLAYEHRPDVVLLDLMLPDLPGTEVCRTLKGDSTTKGCAVIMVTAKGEEIDRVVGFELGADDYVVKPFSVRELLLRVSAILRRSSERPPTSSFQFGCLRVDRDAHRAWVHDREIEMTPLEFKLLTTLHDRRDRVQTRMVLLSDVWGIDADITTRTVDTHVKRLREKLGSARDLLETVRGVGYRLVDPQRK